jgi:uncharacterized membrane protein
MKKEFKKEITNKDRRLYGILAYLGILIVVPFLIAKEDSFVMFHLKQGLLVFIVWMLLISTPLFLNFLYPVHVLISLFLLFMVVMGIKNVLDEKEKELPLIGHLADKFNF